MDILTKVKTALHITGTFQDEALNIFIEDVKNFLLDGGVHPSVVESEAAVGIIVRGVIDTWDYGAGKGDYSQAFMKRAFQLKNKEVKDDV